VSQLYLKVALPGYSAMLFFIFIHSFSKKYADKKDEI